MNKILLVDDETSILDTLRHYLEAQGYMVITAETGKMGLNWIKEEKLDLAVIDLGLPDVSGLELCKAIKGDPRTRGIPVIILTGDSSNEARIESNLTARADLFLNKPIRMADLKTAIEKLFDKAEKEKLLFRASLKFSLPQPGKQR